ncbi:MAG: CBS and ACT domain-containing protein [Desulfoarculaceae bacterium]|nr:CBS and ACT domain-containing protein [Desulfoarculaceae bacterium]
MLIKDWMATTILTVDANTSVMRATRTMKENNIRRLPVLSHGKLAGIITDRDLKDASPSSKADMDIHEMYYLLSEMKVKDVMTGSPVCLKKDDTLEKAALVMLGEKISGLLIVDDNDNLVGLLSESDVLRGFIHATGIQDGAYQFVIDMSDAGGSVSLLVDILRQHHARILSILTSFNDAPPGFKRVSVRILSGLSSSRPGASDTEPPLADELDINAIAGEIAAMDGYNIVSQSLDDLSNLPKK